MKARNFLEKMEEFFFTKETQNLFSLFLNPKHLLLKKLVAQKQ